VNTVTTYIDPACPWAWRTSLWLREVQRLDAIRIDWKLFSLAEVNRDRDVVAEVAAATPAHRALALARREHGQDAFDHLYLALGQARFDRRADLGDHAVIGAALEQAALPGDILERALADQSTNDEVLKEHADAVERYDAFGVPWLVVDRSPLGFYGPIIADVPTGDEALDLWTHTAWLFQKRYFFEMKRPR
jgi:predicted DsbA family dithiol-disulfide isomerase